MLLEDTLRERGHRLILASQSPRRRELMTECGFEFRTVKYDVDEIYPTTTPAAEVAEYLAKLKSEGYPERLSEGEILITADTVVVLGDRVLGKPKDGHEAHEMLRALSGTTHEVITGVALRSATDSRSFSSSTQVRFATLSESQIAHYIERYSPFDKAGSYGIQEWIGYVGIESIEGSFYNVMGLPIQRLYSELALFIG
ncbi:MAG: Maf family nucleotide pyrophosphatase [Rikenellaceae bacterium]